jgi:hypothetical protein
VNHESKAGKHSSETLSTVSIRRNTIVATHETRAVGPRCSIHMLDY